MLNLKRIVSVVLTLAIIVVLPTISASAEDYAVPGKLASYGEQIYKTAKANFGRRSFSGYCGTYVRLQLHAMGILNDEFDFHVNGNKWYGNLKDLETTPTGYYVYSESGENCLEKMAEKY